MNIENPLDQEWQERNEIITARKNLRQRILDYCGPTKGHEILSQMVIMNQDLKSNQEMTKKEFIEMKKNEKIKENNEIEELMKMPPSSTGIKKGLINSSMRPCN